MTTPCGRKVTRTEEEKELPLIVATSFCLQCQGQRTQLARTKVKYGTITPTVEKPMTFAYVCAMCGIAFVICFLFLN